MWTGVQTSIRMRIHVWTWTQHRHGAGTPLNPLYPFGLCTGSEIRFESSLSTSSCTVLVPVSHVQSHPGMHASNPGWLWTRPIFLFERVIGYQEYTRGFVVPFICDYYAMAPPKLKCYMFCSHWVPKVWPLFQSRFFVSFKRRHEKHVR